LTTMIQELKRYLEVIASFQEGMNGRDNLQFKSYEALVLHYGYGFQGRPLGETDLERGEKKLCFMNALLVDSSRYTYCEGWGISEDLAIPIQHAWVIDRQGNAYDPTWDYDTKAFYFGVPINHSWAIERTLEQEVYGILPNDFLVKPRLLEAGFEKHQLATSATDSVVLPLPISLGGEHAPS